MVSVQLGQQVGVKLDFGVRLLWLGACINSNTQEETPK